MRAANDSPLGSGFADPVLQATACFRQVMNAMAHPGSLQPLDTGPEAPAGLNRGAVQLLLTLADYDTPVWLAPGADSPQARQFLQFHAGCPLVADPGRAAIAVMPASADNSLLETLPVGTPEYPDRSATVILICDRLEQGQGRLFRGPGIDGEVRFDCPDLPETLWRMIAANSIHFPCGLDWIFATGTAIAALPRSSRMEDTPCM